MLGGDRFPYHGNFVPGSANGIGFEDLVVIEDYEFCRAVAERRQFRPGFEEALAWVVVQAALLRSRQRALGGGRLAAGGLSGQLPRQRPRGARPERPGSAPDRRDRRRPDRPHARRAARRRGPGRARRRRERHAGPRPRGRSAPSSGCARAPSVEELLGAPDVDAVAICSSTDTHADLLVAAAEAGKAIFCEKPVSLDLAEVDRALAAVEDAGVPFQIGFNRRFDPAHASVRGAVADGTVGEPHIVRITSRDPAPPPLAYVRVSGGIFLDMTIHDFDMARFVTGSEVVEVFARGAVRVDPQSSRRPATSTPRVVTLAHENGCLTTIDNSRQAVYGYDQRVEVFGSRGMAASENPLAHSGLVRTAEGTRAAALPHFFLERYRRATCASGRVRRGDRGGRAAAGDRAGRARAARDRPGRVALAARGPAGASGGGRRGSMRVLAHRRPRVRRLATSPRVFAAEGVELPRPRRDASST